MGFLHSLVSKESACNAGDPGLIPGSGRSPEEGNGNPLQYSYLENPRQRSLAGYSSRVTRLGHDLATKFSSAQFSPSVMSDSLRPHESQHARPPCPSPTPRVHSSSCSSSWWCHPAISYSVFPFSSHLQSFPASGSFPLSQFFASGGQGIGVSASVLPMNIQEILKDFL